MTAANKIRTETRPLERRFVSLATDFPLYTITEFGHVRLTDTEANRVWQRMRDEISPDMDDFKAENMADRILLEEDVELPYAEETDPATLANEIARRHYMADQVEYAQRVTRHALDMEDDKVRQVVNKMYEQKPVGAEHLPTAFTITEQFTEKWNSDDDYPVLSTGFNVIDRALGGLMLGTNTVLGAREGGGKTTLALQIAEHAAQEHKVIFYSLDMDAEFMWARQACNRLKEPFTDFMNQNMPLDKRREVMSYAAELALEVEPNLLIPSDVKTTTSDIWRHAIQEQPKLIVVDHVRYVADRAGNSEVQRLGAIMRNLKQIAKLGVAVVTLTQLRKNIRDDRRPTRRAIRASGQIAEDADVVLMMHNQGFYDPEHPQDVVALYPVKLRAGDMYKDIWLRFRHGIFDEDYKPGVFEDKHN